MIRANTPFLTPFPDTDGPQVAQTLHRPGLAGLADRKRCGRPRVYAGVVVAQAKAIACELPATRGVPLGRWSVGEVRAELLASGIAPNVSVSTVGRWLSADAIRPWRYRSWIFPRRP